MLGSFAPDPEKLLAYMPWHWVWAWLVIFVPFHILEYFTDNVPEFIGWWLFPIIVPCWILMIVGYILLAFLFDLHRKTHTLWKYKNY